MRAGAGFNATAVAAAAAPVVTGGGDHLTWHSPVPYLFGGLAAMLGLIALALLILACSYWKISGYFEGGEDTGSGVELSVKPAAAPTVYEEKVVVIMAGDAKPTFLATPMSTRASSFGDQSSQNDYDDDDHDAKKKEEETGNETETRSFRPEATVRTRTLKFEAPSPFVFSFYSSSSHSRITSLYTISKTSSKNHRRIH